METHNNPELIKIFRDLARAEGIHGEEIRRMAGDFDVAARAREIAKFETQRKPGRGRSRLRPLPDDALACVAAFARRRKARA